MKLIEFFGDRFDAENKYVPGQHVELYDLSKDIGETNNLALEKPWLAKELLGQLRKWMAENSALASMRNLHFDPNRAFEATNRKPAWLK